MAVNLAAIREKYQELKNKKSSGGDNDWMELQQGDNLVRFLSDEDGDFYYETGYHYIKQGKDKAAVICNRLNSGDDCYLCDVVSELYKSKDKSDKELAKEISAKARIFFNVVDREDGKIKVLGAGNMIFKDLLKYFADEDWGDLTDVKAGHDVVINKTGEGMDTVYTVMPKPKPTKLGIDDPELHDLAAIAEGSVYSCDEQEMILGGMSTEDVIKARGDSEPKKDTKKPEPKKEAAKTPSRKPTAKPDPEPMTPEEEFADKLAMVDMDIPKAAKAVKNWLADDDRTEDELDDIIAKYPVEESEPEPEPVKKSTKPSKSEEPQDDLDAEVAAALARFKKGKK